MKKTFFALFVAHASIYCMQSPDKFFAHNDRFQEQDIDYGKAIDECADAAQHCFKITMCNSLPSLHLLKADTKSGIRSLFPHLFSTEAKKNKQE